LGYDANGISKFDETQLTLLLMNGVFYKKQLARRIGPKQGNYFEDQELSRFFKLMADFRTKKKTLTESFGL
jgi:hypothetical protein